MAKKDYAVYVLLNREHDPRYVGVGKSRKGIAPWEIVWLDRFKAEDTQFTRWLRECNEQPIHRVVAQGIAQGVAVGIAAAERQRLVQSGEELLSTRMIAEGHGLPRAVVDPNGDLFVSAREAAKAHGLVHSSVSRWAARQVGGWRFADSNGTAMPEQGGFPLEINDEQLDRELPDD